MDRKKKLICLVRLIGEFYIIKVMNKKIIQGCVGELLKKFINTRNGSCDQGSFNFEDYIETLIDLYDKSRLL